MHRECSHRDHEVVGRCVCEEGYEQVSEDSIACDKKGAHNALCYGALCINEKVCLTTSSILSYSQLSRKFEVFTLVVTQMMTVSEVR